MKRLISIFVTILMVTTMVLPTAVFAEETESAFDPFAGDYVAGELTDNLLQQPGNVYVVDMASNIDRKGDAIPNHTRHLTKTSDFTANLSGWSRGLAGLQYIGNSPTQGFANGFKVEGQDTLVFSYALRNYGTTDSFVWNAALANSSWSFSGSYPVEYGNTGFVISDKENWVEFKGTCKMPGVAGTMYTPTFMIGFQSAAAGSSAEVNYGSKASKPYVALEVAHDIVVEATTMPIIKGIPAEFSAKVVNQVGSTGYLTQPTFNFTTFGSDGNPVEGLTVSADGIVSATDAVADGTYYVRVTAAIDEDTTWQKTVAFNVAGALENTDDYVAKSANAIATPSKAENFNQFNVGSSVISPVTTTPGVYIWNVKSETPESQAHTGKMAGSLFRTSGGDYIDSDFKILTGEKLILKMAVKNVGSTDSVRVNASLSNNVGYPTANFSEEYGSDGVLVTDKDNWTILTFTLTMPGAAGTEYKPRLAFGFPAGTPEGSGIAINLSTQGVPQAFVGKEEPNDIRVTGASSSVAAGSSLDLEAEVFNSEFDAEFTGSFDWVAVNTDRTNYVDGITFTPSNNGANVKVNVAENVAPGNYLVVAQNKTYGMNRQYPITVTAPSYDVTEFELTTTSATATLEALEVTSDDDVMVIVAAFSGNKMMVAEDTTLTPVEGVAALADPIQLTGLSAGYEVRVFVWDEEYTPFTMKRAWKLPVTIE